MTALAARRRDRSRRGIAGSARSRVGGRPGVETPEPTLFDAPAAAVGAEPTLDAHLSGTWEALAAHRRVACPVCAGEMTAGEDAGGAVVIGRCRDCGTELA